jgi:hypothetical protein
MFAVRYLVPLLHAVLLLSGLHEIVAASKKKRHAHNGVLTPFDGRQLEYNLSPDQYTKLKNGDPVVINERKGSSGRGIVVQDIKAPPHVCMDRITDLDNYKKMVPNVKSVVTDKADVFSNGTLVTSATFNVGISFMGFTYYLLLKYDPTYFTYTWTLDYQYASDFDDNTGHWQVMPHPTEEGMSRVLYSTEVRLFSWVPEFVITFLTKTALVESTTWVKRESEKLAKEIASGAEKTTRIPEQFFPAVKSCVVETPEGGVRYDAKCADGLMESVVPEEKPGAIFTEESLEAEALAHEEALAQRHDEM